MKKILIAAVAIVAIQVTGFSQPPGGFQRQTVEQRVEAIHHKLDSAFKLAPEKLTTLDKALTVLYKQQDEKMQELMSGGNMDRDAMMAERKKYSDARDEMIKTLVTADQYTIWKDTIEPSMRPQRPGGGNRQN